MRVKESIIGCLTVRVNPISVPDCCSVSAESTGEPISLSADSANTTVYIHVGNKNEEVTCAVISQNTPPRLEGKGQNIKIKITAALICQVSLGVYEYFYVVEGPLVVEEGYFKVRRR